MARWTSWSGLSSADPAEERTPHDVSEVVDAVLDARRQGRRVKMPGHGHSFTDIAVTDGLLLHPGSLRGIVGVDRVAMTVTVLAGTPLHELNDGLVRLGLSLHNMGDIDVQTVAGAVSTGTHGTGGRVASLSSQVSALELVTGEGELVAASRHQHPEVFDHARLGLGALGILTSLTFDVEPLGTLAAHEVPMRWDEALGGFDELVAQHEHVEIYWFPHTDRLLSKRNDRTTADPEPLSRSRAWLEDELLANRVFGWANRLGNARPALVPRINAACGRALGERRFSDVPHRVFTSPRRVVFREMEYALPRAVGLDALREVRALVDRSDWRIGFPVEVRTAPADDVPLSAATGRDSLYLAFHTNARADHRPYFDAVEAVVRDHGGRPHWGKLHGRTAADLAPAYPRFGEFLALRDRLDPDRLFTNDYLDRVLGA